MNKQREIKSTSYLDNVVRFPSKINIITIFFIVILYGIILILLLNVISPKYDYVVELNYAPSTYNEEINPFVILRGTPSDVDKDSNTVTIGNTYRVYAYVESMNSLQIENIKYAFSGLDNGGVMRYIVESATKTGYKSLPVTHYASSPTNPLGGGYDKLFMQVRYDLTKNEETVTKEVELSEKVIQLYRFELNDKKFTNKSTIDDIVSLTFTMREDQNNQYLGKFKIEPKHLDVPYHINMQSWLVTDNNQIYPYLGVYNLSTRKALNPTYEYAIDKDYITPKWLYVKLEYKNYTTNEISNLYYKVSIADLVG